MNNSAIIVEIKEIVSIPQANSLVMVKLFGTQVLTSKDVKEGDLMIYFDSNLKLSEEYLSNNNLYRDASLNKDPQKTGYFDNNGRVRAIKLLGEFSDGILMPIQSLDYTGIIDYTILKPGYQFQEYANYKICKKYIPQVNAVRNSDSKKSKNKPKRTKKVSSPMFVEHLDTDQFFKNSHKVPANTICYIIEKTHGTSGRIGNMLVDTSLEHGWFKRTIMRLFNLQSFEYRYIHGSRRVTLNLNPKNYQPYHDPSMREEILKSVEGKLPKGVEIYFEIYGYEPNGKHIQSGFSYGCKPGYYGVKLYRVTMNNQDGDVVDYSPEAVQILAEQLGFNQMYIFEKYFYDGSEESKKILDQKVIDYAQGQSVMDDKTLKEGVIVQFINSRGKWDYLKYKSDAFRALESKNKDKGIIDVEDIN